MSLNAYVSGRQNAVNVRSLVATVILPVLNVNILTIQKNHMVASY